MTDNRAAEMARRWDLILSFQTILYCTNKTEPENAFIAALKIGQKFPKWQEYLSNQFSMKENGV